MTILTEHLRRVRHAQAMEWIRTASADDIIERLLDVATGWYGDYDPDGPMPSEHGVQTALDVLGVFAERANNDEGGEIARAAQVFWDSDYATIAGSINRSTERRMEAKRLWRELYEKARVQS